MKKEIILVTVFLVSLIHYSCRPKIIPARTNGVISPQLSEGAISKSADNAQALPSEKELLPLVGPGQNRTIMAVLNIGLDLDPSEEQVIVSRLVASSNPDLQIALASINTTSNRYSFVWKAQLINEALTDITLRSIDVTGNGRNDLIVTGFNEKNENYTEIFAIGKQQDLKNYRRVFQLQIAGNIDLITKKRSGNYNSGLANGMPFDVLVQQIDPDSDNEMDVLENNWKWNPAKFSYEKDSTRRIRAESILEERIKSVYTGNVKVYEDYLRGVWYRPSNNGDDWQYVYFNDLAREIIFSDGEIQEILDWGTSNRTTAKRLYTRVNNAIIPSNFDTISVSADSWDIIEVFRIEPVWNGQYSRLTSKVTGIENVQKPLESIITNLNLNGSWQSSGDLEIIFNFPEMRWIENGVTRKGAASIIEIADTAVLQIQFMKRRGVIEDTVDWIIDYSVNEDSSRIVRSLLLTPVSLNVNGLAESPGNALRFEQIEIISIQDS